MNADTLDSTHAQVSDLSTHAVASTDSLTRAGRVRAIVLCTVSCAALWFSPSHAHAVLGVDDPLASVETEVGPLDFPGREPAPRTAEEAAPTTTQPAPTPVEREWLDGKSWFDWSRATGDWGGVRTALEDSGLTISSTFTLDWSTLFNGGINKRASTRRLFDINATLDLDKLLGWKGGSVYADFYHIGGNTTNDVGDFSGATNTFAAQHRDQLAELWFQQVLFDGGLRIKAGKIEANREFAFTSSALTFLGTGTNWSQTIQGFPSFPDPATGVVVFVYPTKSTYAGFGFFDGALLDGIRTGSRGPSTFFSDSQSSDWFFIGEAGITWNVEGNALKSLPLGKGRLAGGVWGHTHRFNRFDGSEQSGAIGGYAIAEQQVWRTKPSDKDSDQGLWLFGRFGIADERVAPIGLHFGAGFSLKGTFEGRDADEIGLSYNWHQTSDFAGAPYTGNEQALEAFYKLQLFGSASIMPNIQWTQNPGGDGNAKDAVLATLRFNVSF